MEINIRKSIINNFKDSTRNELLSSINEAISSKEELVLPGLGVLLEIVWPYYSKEEKEAFVDLFIKKMNN